MIGTVFLVGAGPGDPGLLTLAGRDALAAADVVFYDALVHPASLLHCRDNAELVFVGKRAEKHFVKQGDTNSLIADAALAGKTVVRLKGGDPFVFGRGGEECAFLAGRGVPFVVVPGVTSAIAAPAYAGIPVTHRDASSSFAVITGHERGDRAESSTRDGGTSEGRRRWDRIAFAADTLIFLMGVESLAEIAARLIEHGRTAETPVAVIQWGTWTTQRTVTGTLSDIAGVVQRENITAPAVTVVGDVVNYRDALRWFDNRPLFGQKIVVTRAREQASTVSAKLRALGAEPIEFPTIQIGDPDDDYAALFAALGNLSSYDWVIFTSANGVWNTIEWLARDGRDARAFGGAKVAAIGSGTRDALSTMGIFADFVPTEFVAEVVLAQFPETELSGKRILLPRAADARLVLPDGLRERGAIVDDVAAYKTRPVAVGGGADLRQQLIDNQIDAILFSSASTVRNFADALGDTSLIGERVRLIAIGPITAAEVEKTLRAPDAIAEEHNIDGLLRALTDSRP